MTQNPAQERIALAYQRSLNLIGVAMGIRSVDDGQYQARSNSFDYDMIIRSLPSSLSPGMEQAQPLEFALTRCAGQLQLCGCRQSRY